MMPTEGPPDPPAYVVENKECDPGIMFFFC